MRFGSNLANAMFVNTKRLHTKLVSETRCWNDSLCLVTVGDSPKEIAAWVSNTGEASYFSMAIHGQTFFRLNYPLKLNSWVKYFMTCISSKYVHGMELILE